jgi:predicted DNA-binding transcriptional regulator YafY
VAYDLDRADWRSFRLDRLTGPTPLGARFRQRTLPAEDAASFVRRGMQQMPSSFDVEALVEAPPDVVRTRLGPWATVEDAQAGAARPAHAHRLPRLGRAGAGLGRRGVPRARPAGAGRAPGRLVEPLRPRRGAG